MDRSLSFIECKLDSASRKLETFDKIDSYTYDKSCERALLIEQVPILGEFAIVLDSLDGTYEKSRMGVRLGQASVVVGVFNHTIISEQDLDSFNITVTTSPDVLRIYPELLGVKIMIHKNGFEIRVEKNSRLSSFKGLCGNSTGNLVFRNGAAVDVSDSSSLEKALAQYLTPPSETFVRNVTRKQCGELLHSSLVVENCLFINFCLLQEFLLKILNLVIQYIQYHCTLLICPILTLTLSALRSMVNISSISISFLMAAHQSMAITLPWMIQMILTEIFIKLTKFIYLQLTKAADVLTFLLP